LAAVDGEEGTRDEAGFVGGQEQCGVCDVPGCALAVA